MRYRITVRRVEEIVIEGDSSIEYALERQQELDTGIVAESDGEVSSFRVKWESPKTEFLLGETEEGEIWGMLS